MNYLLADAAEADLRAIIRYTRTQWGPDQTRSYMAKLHAGITRIAVGHGSFKTLDALYPALRVAHCGHHYVFCLPRSNAPALILAILHERMDIITHVAARLDA